MALEFSEEILNNPHESGFSSQNSEFIGILQADGFDLILLYCIQFFHEICEKNMIQRSCEKSKKNPVKKQLVQKDQIAPKSEMIIPHYEYLVDRTTDVFSSSC